MHYKHVTKIARFSSRV